MDPVIDRLLAERAIDDARLAEGKEIADGAGLPLIRVLLHLKLVEPSAVAAALAAELQRPILDLKNRVLPPSPLAAFPAGLCRELRVLPLALEPGESADEQQLVLAMSDPSDRNAGERVAAFVAKDVRPVLVADDALATAIARRYEEPATTDHTVLMLVDALSSDEATVTPFGREPQPISSDGEVFATSADERTELMRAPPPALSRDTVMVRSPFLEPSREMTTDTSSVFADACVYFVSPDKKARLRVAADLAPLVKTALVLDDLKRAAEAAERDAPDEVVVHAPKNDAGTGLLLDRIARTMSQGVVVISDEEDFAMLPCVRRRVPLPPTGPAGIAPAILEGLFELFRP